MVSLTDLAALRRFVTVRGLEFQVSGITAEGLVFLIDRWPAFRRMLADRATDLTLDDLKKLGPDILASVIAAGIDKPGDEATELAAKGLTLGEQAEFITTILDLTFPKGLAHFLDSLRALGVGFPDASGDIGRAADMRSPSSLNGSLQVVTDQPSGDTPPAN